jgi:hypothetical protein
VERNGGRCGRNAWECPLRGPAGRARARSALERTAQGGGRHADVACLVTGTFSGRVLCGSDVIGWTAHGTPQGVEAEAFMIALLRGDAELGIQPSRFDRRMRI